METAPNTAFPTFTPPEILIRILQSCQSFQQVLRLATTSRQLYEAWQTHMPMVIWHVGPKEIPAFDTALMAV
jgi:hypothetical protein